MIRFEIKKIFSKTANKIGLIVLLAAIAVTCYFAISSIFSIIRCIRTFARPALADKYGN